MAQSDIEQYQLNRGFLTSCIHKIYKSLPLRVKVIFLKQNICESLDINYIYGLFEVIMRIRIKNLYLKYQFF